MSSNHSDSLFLETLLTQMTGERNFLSEKKGETKQPSFSDSTHLSFANEIFALYPIEVEGTIQTVVLYQEHLQLIELPPLAIINQWLGQFHFDYTKFCSVFEGFQTLAKYCMPASDTTYSLIPIGSPKDKKTIWINAQQIQLINQTASATRIQLLNKVSLPSIKKEVSLKKNIRNGIATCHLLNQASVLWYTHAQQIMLNNHESLHLPRKSLARKLITSADLHFTWEEIETIQQKIIEVRQLNHFKKKHRKKI